MSLDDYKNALKTLIEYAYHGELSGQSATRPVTPGKTYAELSPRQRKNIAPRLGDYFDEETAVLFYDTSLTNSGKSGFLFTIDGVIGIDFTEAAAGKGLPPMLLYEDLRAVRQGQDKEKLQLESGRSPYISPSHTIAEYNDGTIRVVYTSIYTQFIVNAMQEIIDAMHTEVPEEAASPEPEDLPSAAGSAPEAPNSAPEAPSSVPEVSASTQDADASDQDLSNIIELRDENGNPIYFEFLDLIEYEGNEYIVLMSVDENQEPNSDEVIILQVLPIEGDEQNEQYVPIEDEDTLAAVFAIFRDKFKDMFAFEEPEATIRADQENGSDLPYPYGGEQPYVFISYSHRDSNMVMGIIRQLQADGYRVWYDEGIDPGTEWDDNIADHVSRCGCFLAFISGNYLQSENCKDELNYARDLNLPRLLIYLEDVALTGGLAMRHNRLQAVHYYKYATMKGMFYKRLYESSVFTGTNLKD
ncbi:MAG: TIR domain-containing protein [Firmicutes bacterium]|nr:TIR domain-containing protein [Bacillota bacterium]